MAQASVLFSGGTDSALAAVLMLHEARKVVLLTFEPGHAFFARNSAVHAELLAHRMRFVLRYVLAAVMIPIGVLLGVGGLVHHCWRRRLGR